MPQIMTYIVDVNGPLSLVITSDLMQKDRQANTIKVLVQDRRDPVDMTGWTALYTMEREDGVRVVVEGQILENEISVTLTDACYQVAGRYAAFIRITSPDTEEKRTVLRMAGLVVNEGNGPVIDGSYIIPSLEDLLAQIAAMEAATEAANKAAERAENAAGNIEISPEAIQDAVNAYLEENPVESVSPEEIAEAVDAALQEAKESGDFDGEPGKNGISPTITTSKSGKVTTLTIKDANGTKTETINDGADGYTPQKGKDYFDGDPGVSATHKWNGTTLTITSASGTSSADLKGDPGDPGSDATVTPESIQTALGYTPLKSSGWSAGKNLGTDENGNVIEKEDIFSKDTSAWAPVEYMTGVEWTEKGYYWQANGTHTNTQYTQAYQSTKELIRIEPNCSYTISGFAGAIWLYDSTGKNGVLAFDPIHYDPTTSDTFTTNANQYYIGLSHQPSGSWTVDRVSLVRNTISQAEYDALPTRADSLKSLYGKKVVCFGDSLFGMYRGADSAPAFIAAETGATVYNVGFGGCRMAVHPTSGYGAFSMWALAKAIAENDWATQDAQASSGSSYFTEQLALLKSIDFSKVDIAVIHYGTNDFASGNGVPIDNASDHDDYNSLCGALRYSLDKLLGKYPKLRIYVSLPVYRFWTDSGTTTYAETYLNKNGETLPEFVEALRGVAAEYNLPVIDGYYGLGINKANAATFLSDGTHHNVAGRERFGRYIGSNLAAQQTSGKSGVDMTAVQALIDNSIGAAIGGSY